jgi:hypothetical protein
MADPDYAEELYNAELKKASTMDMGKNSELKQVVAEKYGQNGKNVSVDGNKIIYYDENDDKKEIELTDE